MADTATALPGEASHAVEESAGAGFADAMTAGAVFAFAAAVVTFCWSPRRSPAAVGTVEVDRPTAEADAEAALESAA